MCLFCSSHFTKLKLFVTFNLCVHSITLSRDDWDLESKRPNEIMSYFHWQVWWVDKSKIWHCNSCFAKDPLPQSRCIHPQYRAVHWFPSNRHPQPGTEQLCQGDIQAKGIGLKALVLLSCFRVPDEFISPVLFCVNLLLSLEVAWIFLTQLKQVEWF